MINVLFTSHANEFPLSEIAVILNNVDVKSEKFTKMSRARLHRYVSHYHQVNIRRKILHSHPMLLYIPQNCDLDKSRVMFKIFCVTFAEPKCRSGLVIGYFRKEIR